MSTMRAKFKVTKVENTSETNQQVQMMAVTSKPFDSEGNSEDNSFARWTPSAELKMSINNPNLMGSLKEGQNFYVDFTNAGE